MAWVRRLRRVMVSRCWGVEVEDGEAIGWEELVRWSGFGGMMN